jgi:hypothetical protein
VCEGRSEEGIQPPLFVIGHSSYEFGQMNNDGRGWAVFLTSLVKKKWLCMLDKG